MELYQVFNICLQTEYQIAQTIYNDEELEGFTFYTNASFKTCYLVCMEYTKQNSIMSVINDL